MFVPLWIIKLCASVYLFHVAGESKGKFERWFFSILAISMWFVPRSW